MRDAGLIVGGLANVSDTENSIRSHGYSYSSFSLLLLKRYFILTMIV